MKEHVLLMPYFTIHSQDEYFFFGLDAFQHLLNFICEISMA